MERYELKITTNDSCPVLVAARKKRDLAVDIDTVPAAVAQR